MEFAGTKIFSDMKDDIPFANEEAEEFTPEVHAKERPASAKPEYVEDCTACRGTGRFHSYSGRYIGPCFKCDGKGKKTFKQPASVRAATRTKLAEKKERKAQEALEKFGAEHPAEMGWIFARREKFSFATQMYEEIQKYGDLTLNQLAAVQRCIEGDAKRADERKEAVAKAPEATMPAVEAAFTRAFAAGIKNPKLRLGTFRLTPAKAASANAGAIYVKEECRAVGEVYEGAYLGKIMGGKFIRSRECSDEQEKSVLEIAADPKAAAIAYGKRYGVCSVCGRALTDKTSIENGIGPICSDNYGF